MNVYGYSRISRDEDRENYDTIMTQNKMIERYSKSELEYPVLKIFEDDNISGYTFNREGLNKLKQLIETGKVDILLTKDLSRLGRHNAKTLLFLEYLEEHGVRLILIHDSYDSAKDDDDIIGIKTWYNEKYIKDLSRKIKANLEVKQKESGLITKVPFGYKRSEADRHRLVIDEEAALIVKRLFRLYIEGHGGRKIANIINKEKAPTPSKYVFEKTGKKISGNIAELWNGNSVMSILKNDVYIGHLRCGKTQRKKINGKNHRLDKSEHIVHKNHHDPIVSKEDFELVQKILKSRLQNKVRGKKKEPGINLFIGFLNCGNCNGGFMRVDKKNSVPSYICSNYHHYGAKFCTTHRVGEEQLKEIILDKLKLMKFYIEDGLKKLDNEINNLINSTVDYDRKIKKYKIKITDKKEEVKNYSRQLAQGIISEEIAIEMIERANRELKEYEQQINELINIEETRANIKTDAIKSLDIINEIIENGDLTRKDLEKLINQITVKQISQPKPNVKPILSIDIEWDIFMGSTHKILKVTEYNQPHGNHAGDFPVLFSNNGYSRMIFFTDKFEAEEVIGKSVIIHENPNDYRSQPSGNAGKRIACGVIEEAKI